MKSLIITVSLNYIRVIKSQKMISVEAKSMQGRCDNEYKQNFRLKPFEITRHTWKDHIKMHLRDTEC